MGECLRSVLSERDFAVRYGGDEFIVISSLQPGQDLEDLAARIRSWLENAGAAGRLPCPVSLSMGTAVYDPAWDTLDTFLQRMDDCMYQEKRRHYSQTGYDRRASRKTAENP